MSKRRFRPAVIMVVLVIVVVTTLSSGACAQGVKTLTASMAAKALEDKYDIEFGVSSIGRRLNSDLSNTITAYCYPVDNPDILFEAILNNSYKLISDTYPDSLVENTIKNKIKAEFAAKDIVATVNISVSKIVNEIEADGNLEAAIESNPEISITFSTIVKDCQDASTLYNTIVKILEEFVGKSDRLQTGTTVWNMGEEDYNNCVNAMSRTTNVNQTFIERYNPTSNVVIAIVEGNVSISEEAFCESFK